MRVLDSKTSVALRKLLVWVLAVKLKVSPWSEVTVGTTSDVRELEIEVFGPNERHDLVGKVLSKLKIKMYLQQPHTRPSTGIPYRNSH